MVAIPTVAQEDARRLGRERDALITERTRLTNTIKAELALWGIQGFKPGLKKAAVSRPSRACLCVQPDPTRTEQSTGSSLEIAGIWVLWEMPCRPGRSR
jgi:transposase